MYISVSRNMSPIPMSADRISDMVYDAPRYREPTKYPAKNVRKNELNNISANDIAALASFTVLLICIFSVCVCEKRFVCSLYYRCSALNSIFTFSFSYHFFSSS